MKKILSLVLGLLWALPVLAQENYLSALSLSGTFVTGAEKPYKIPVRVSNGETSQTGYIYADAPVYKLSNYADVVDFQTGKITRNIKKDVFTGAEAWGYSGYAPGKLFIFNNDAKKELVLGASNYYQFVNNISTDMPDKSFSIQGYSTTQNGIFLNDKSYTSAAAWKAHLTELYNAGQPLEIYVVTNTPTVEEINLSSLPQMSGNVTYQVIFPEPQITIATTKYNETKFSPLNTALANAISVVDSVVSNTITQAGRIATLQAQKQTRPNDIADDNEKCPAGIKCLLVEDANGTPHWYAIQESYLPLGYTPLEYIESTGTQYIDTGVTSNEVSRITVNTRWRMNNFSGNTYVFGSLNRNASVIKDSAFGGLISYIDGKYYSNNYSFTASITQIPRQEVSFNTDYEYELKYENQRSSVKINDRTMSFLNDNAIKSIPLSIYICKGNDDALTDGFEGRIYYLKIELNGALVRDFIPAKNPDGKIGMYDLVGGRFYENKGTGEFIGGQPVFN